MTASGTNWKDEKLRLEKSSLEERRQNYFCQEKFVPITEIPKWNEYFFQNGESFEEIVSEEDIKTFAANGISHLRIPVAYWIWDVSDDEPFPPPPANDDEAQRFYLKRQDLITEKS